MAKPTEGEWKLNGIVVYAEGGGVVCEISEPRGTRFIQHKPLGYGSKDRAEAMANGRLIVASKRLLGALENLLRTRTTQHRIGLWPERFPGLKDRPTSFNRFKIWLTRATVAVIEAEDAAHAAIEAATKEEALT